MLRGQAIVDGHDGTVGVARGTHCHAVLGVEVAGGEAASVEEQDAGDSGAALAREVDPHREAVADLSVLDLQALLAGNRDAGVLLEQRAHLPALRQRGRSNRSAAAREGCRDVRVKGHERGRGGSLRCRHTS